MKRFMACAVGAMIVTSVYAKVYSPPAGKPTAMLTVQNLLPVGWIRPATFSQPRDCSAMRTLVKGGWGPPILFAGKKVEVPIEADQEFTLYMEVAQGNVTSFGACRVIRSFVPQAGSRYLVEASIRDNRCYVGIALERTDSSGKVYLEPVVSRERSVPEIHPGYIGSQCTPDP